MTCEYLSMKITDHLNLYLRVYCSALENFAAKDEPPYTLFSSNYLNYIDEL